MKVISKKWVRKVLELMKKLAKEEDSGEDDEDEEKEESRRTERTTVKYDVKVPDGGSGNLVVNGQSSPVMQIVESMSNALQNTLGAPCTASGGDESNELRHGLQPAPTQQRSLWPAAWEPRL